MRIALCDLSFETEHLHESSAQNDQGETVQASVAINFFGSTNAKPGIRKPLLSQSSFPNARIRIAQ